MGDAVNNYLWKNETRVSAVIIFISFFSVIIDIITQQYVPYSIVDSVFFVFGFILFFASLYKSYVLCFFTFVIFLALVFVKMWQLMSDAGDFLDCNKSHYRCSSWRIYPYQWQFLLYAIVEGLSIIVVYICFQLLRTDKRISESY